MNFAIYKDLRVGVTAIPDWRTPEAKLYWKPHPTLTFDDSLQTTPFKLKDFGSDATSSYVVDRVTSWVLQKS